jgi:hypothetical protein
MQPPQTIQHYKVARWFLLKRTSSSNLFYTNRQASQAPAPGQGDCISASRKLPALDRAQNTPASASFRMNEVNRELPGSLTSDPQVRCVRPARRGRLLLGLKAPCFTVRSFAKRSLDTETTRQDRGALSLYANGDCLAPAASRTFAGPRYNECNPTRVRGRFVRRLRGDREPLPIRVGSCCPTDTLLRPFGQWLAHRLAQPARGGKLTPS